MVTIANARILSLDITAKGFAYAVLEGPERLIDWGTTEIKDRSKNGYVERVESFLWRYFPDLVVLEAGKGAGSRRGERVRNLIQRIELLAVTRGLPVRKVSRGDVRFAFRGSAETKHEIAHAIASLFPELESRLPRFRKPWMSEDERMSIFDAVSFALTVYRSPEQLDEIAA